MLQVICDAGSEVRGDLFAGLDRGAAGDGDLEADLHLETGCIVLQGEVPCSPHPSPRCSQTNTPKALKVATNAATTITAIRMILLRLRRRRYDLGGLTK